MTNNVPDGFKVFEGNVGLTGTLMIKPVKMDAYLGLRIEDKHCNIANICHGGMLMTFADMQLGSAVRRSPVFESFYQLFRCPAISSLRCPMAPGLKVGHKL